MTAFEESERNILVDVRSFSELLQWFRRRSHFTQKQLADQLGVRRSTISDWENNQFAPKYRDHIAKLAEIFGLSPVETNQFLQSAHFHLAPAEPTFETENPYKGLSAFTQTDHHIFFGREDVIEELIEAVQNRMTDQSSPRLLAAIGASGSGKTSTLLAGLLPSLQHGAIPGSQDWIYIEPLRPGRDPLLALADALSPSLERDPEAIRSDLETSPDRLSHLASQLVEETRRPVVLIIDQLEELFSQEVQEHVCNHFLRLLTTACGEPESPILLILALRADFYGSLTTFPEFARLVTQCQHLLLSLDQERETLRRIIEQPARLPQVQLTFEGNLIDEILFDLQGQVGVLPLLQFTLDQLFQRRQNHLLTLRAYQEIGKVKGALAQHVEQIYRKLPSENHRQLARFLFLRLLQREKQETETALITRRQARLEEFVLSDAQETQTLREVITTFVGKRLLVTSRSGDSSILEVSHEALLQEWSRLGSWIEEAQEDIELQQTLDRVASEWEGLKKPSDRLYRGAQLKAAQAWARRNRASRQEQAFLHASALGRLRALVTVIGVVLLVVASSGIAGWLLLFPPNSQPTPNRVTNAHNDGAGSLRWAITNARAGSTITFASNLAGQTITLTNGDIHIFQQKLTIQGLSPGHITIREIGAGLNVDAPASVTIADLAFQGSKTDNQPALIANQGNLTLTHCTFSGNTSGFGGIVNFGTLAMSNSTVSGNTTQGLGGGIGNHGTLTMMNSIVSDNTSFGQDAGIDNSGTLVLMSSTVSDNTAFGLGGGIGNAATLTMMNSTVSNNTASGQGGRGGGIYNGGILIMKNSTISGNTASVQGGGIFNQSFEGIDLPANNVVIMFCTIVNNSISGSDGSEIDTTQNPSGFQLYMTASIIGGNDVQYNPIAGVITSGGYNVVQQMSPENFDANAEHATDRKVSDLTGVLGPRPQLQINGGLTQTFALLLDPQNPALNMIPLSFCQMKEIYDAHVHMYIDQRGMPRPGKNKPSCDGGAYESQR